MANVEAGPVDFSNDYVQHRTELMGKTEESRVQEWLKQQGGPVEVGVVPGQSAEQSKKLEPFPTDKPPPPRQSTAGTVMRNIGEVPNQAVHGVEEAVYNAFGPLNSAVQWLDENVADLRYTNVKTDNQPTTVAGKLSRDLSQFLAGFIPASKALQATALASKVGATGSSMVAGAMADFAVRSGNEERLSNLWQEAGLPKNVLTDYLASSPDDSGAEGRFKGAAEGVLTGAALDGFLRVAGAIKSTRKVATAQRSETELLRARYGEITDEQRIAAIGDASKPLIERATKPVTASTDALGNKWKVEAVAIKEGDKPLYFKITDAEGKELAHADFVEENGKLMAESVIVDKRLKGQGVAEMLYRAASESTGMPIVPGRAQTPDGAGFVKAMQEKGVVARQADGPALDRARMNNTFTGQAKGAGNRVGMTQPKGTPTEKLFSNFNDQKPAAHLTAEQVAEQADRFREDILKRALSAKSIDAKYNDPVKTVVDFDGGLKAEVTAGKDGSTRVVIKDGKTTVAAAAVERGMIDSIATAKDYAGKGIGKKLLAWLDDQRLANVDEVPDRSPGFVQIQKEVISERAARAKAMVVSAEPAPKAIIGGRGSVKAGDQELFINFARIDKPDDVKDAIATMAQAYSGKINEATRGKISHAETARMAEDLGMSVDQLLSRRRGAPMNAEEALAARQLWASSADNLVKLAKAAAGPNAGQLDQFAFRRAMATHAAIQSEVVGSRTETARALSAWRIPAGSGVEQARAIQQVLEGAGGTDESAKLAAKLAILAGQGDKGAVSRFVEKSWGAKSFDALREFWINGLLSSPATHLVNVVSNSAVAFQAVLERGVAAKIGQLRGTEGGVEMGEAMAMAYGSLRSMKDAFVLASRALKTGETGMGLGKIDLPMQRAISTDALQMASDTALGRTVDLLGSAINIPGRLLMAEDELFKTVAYGGELGALSLRQATAEGYKGPALWQRIKEIEADPPASLKISSQDAAAMRTFTDSPGKIGKAFMQLRESAPAWTFVMPFVRTPVNIARYTFERSPLAPLVGQWRDDIAAGGARADLALARMSVGTTIMASALDWADSGSISGKGPKNIGEREALQRQGWQQYSVKVGDRWYSYNRLDPYGALLGFAADAAEAIRSGEMNEDDVDEWSEVLAMGIGATAQVAVNKTYLKGVSDFFAMMHDGTRYGPKYVENLISSFVPFTALSGAVERAVDPVLRETSGPWEAVNAKLAGLSDKLPPRLTLWGDEVRLESGIGKTYDFFSPVRGSEVKANPVDMEINRLSPLAAADNVEGGFQRIGKRTSFMGLEVNFKEYPKAYTEYVRLAGNAAKDPATGLGAKDLLNETVQGKGPLGETYKRLPDIDRIKLISTVITKYRKLAQGQLLSDPEYADFASHLNSTRELLMNYHQQQPAGVVQ